MTQAVYSSAQVARMLGVSGGMVRRYAQALETLTDEEIPQHPRDGRQFAQAHVDALVSARRFVAGRQGMSVETGLRLALGFAELPTAAELPAAINVESVLGSEALKAALGEHIRPLLIQLRTLAESNMQLAEINSQLAAEVESLRSEVKALNPGPNETDLPGMPPEVFEVVQALHHELAAQRRQSGEITELRSKVEALERDRAASTTERIDRALAAELREGSAPPEHPPSGPADDPVADRPGDGPGVSDGLLVRAARWLERVPRR